MPFYTKYRPSDFDNLVGQDFIKETLKKAIAEEKTLWAYLLCGPRWTGKTSTARIFAKAVNCLKPKKWNPCLKCDICKEFAEWSLVDIIEIDAASHTWVDNIREIIEKAQFSPTKTKYKIYIIDEVHMLSKWAFNALLKILEEPPSHLKFILATTETHKVPETIISRCQRYDFKRISENDIENRLKFIAKSEKIKIDKKSLEYIISCSAWGMRNAISLFEQMIVKDEIKYKNIVEKLGIASKDEKNLFLEKLLNKDNEAIDMFENISSSGKNIKLFIKDIIFLAKDNAIKKLKSSENISKYINILEILDESYIKSKNSLDEETTFLIWILKIIGDNSDFETKNWEWNFKEKKEKISPQSFPKEKASELEKTEKREKETSITSDELNNIFWEEKKEENPSDSEKLTKSQNLNSSFDLQKLIEKLKENKAKWAVIFSLKWARINFNWSLLEILVATKMARNALVNTTNSGLIKKSLEELWFKNINLIVK